jgi:hypothetical protein
VGVEFSALDLFDGRDPRAAERNQDADDFGSFAVSGDGWLRLTSGGQIHDPFVRIEEWSGAPPMETDRWEEFDEVPLITVPGVLSVKGDFTDDPALTLPLDHSGRGLARVYASGRHVDDCSSRDAGETGECPERWLVQVWPDPKVTDAMPLGPRHLAAASPWDRVTRSAFSRNMDWFASGWSLLFHSERPYYNYWQLLVGRGHPLTRAELVGGEDARNAPANVMGNALPAGQQTKQQRWDEIDSAAAQLGLPPIRTRDEALNLVLRTGIWTSTIDRDGQEWIAPSPNPPLMHQVLSLPPERERYVRTQIARHVGGLPSADIAHLLRWAPDHALDCSISALAERLALPPSGVRDGLELLDLLGKAQISPPQQTATDDVTLELRAIPKQPRRRG